MTIFVSEDVENKWSDLWYWLGQLGPYSYILTGDVIIIFLIDLSMRLTMRSNTNRTMRVALIGKTLMVAGMTLIIFLCYLVPGIWLQASKDEAED